MTPGAEVSVALWLDGERVWVQGNVTHSIYGCGTGIRFKKVDRAAHERITNLVNSNRAKVSDRRETVVLKYELCPAYSMTS
jgi:hypothetical protein